MRVRDAPRAPDQDRGARDRACRAYPRAAADELPGSGAIPVRRTQLNAVRPMSRGAVCPYEPPTWPINPERAACRVASRRSRRTECRHASARLTCKSAASCMIRVSYGVNLNPYFSVLRDPAHNRFTVNMVALICVRTPRKSVGRFPLSSAILLAATKRRSGAIIKPRGPALRKPEYSCGENL